MKQRDKKVIKRSKDRILNVQIQDQDYYDEHQSDVVHKAKRVSAKSGKSYKRDLQLKPGRIVEVKSNYLNVVRIDDTEYTCTISGRLKQYLFQTRMLSAVGDRVNVDVSNQPDYRIEEILPRSNTLSRYTENSYQKEIVVACNIDYLVITASWALPMLKPGLIDRYLCIAEINRLKPIVCINKIDLCEDLTEAEAAVAYYKKLDIPVIFTSTLSLAGIEELKNLIRDKDSVFSGQSGTGKSSLINALEPGLNLAVSEVSSFNEKGRHTTSQARLLKWSFGGNLVDTPGLKTVNLHRNQKSYIPTVFPGFGNYAGKCYYRGCTHSHETDCAVKADVEKGIIPLQRYDSYLRIMESL
jgi:ribosome biogenesis GTPase